MAALKARLPALTEKMVGAVMQTSRQFFKKKQPMIMALLFVDVY
jgi:hypothetical protein